MTLITDRYKVRPAVQALAEELVATRRDLHQHPELGFEEHRTAALVAERLRALGLEVQEKVGRTGVVGLLRGGQAPARHAPTILVRADMDGLPLQEENQVPYMSQTPATMHACGHDGHVAIGLGVAKILAGMKDRLPGHVKFCFQPAEEGPGGAQPMIEDGVLENPKVHACTGLHLWNVLEVGKIGLRAGPIMACADRFEITVEGKGGHGAAPHAAIDPIVVSAHVVTALQSVVSRQTDPLDSVVVSIGAIHGGKAFNIIPPRVKLDGTLRCLNPELRQGAMEKIDKIASGTCHTFGASCHFAPDFGYPVTVNDEAMTKLVHDVVVEAMAADAVVPTQTLGGEDMSYFLQRVPGCFFFLGSANAARGLNASHHSPHFDFDEAALPLGVELLVRTVERWFEKRIGYAPV
ncbi:MAG TPA: amidohydrolase [Candidatus Xenobia bacterium]|jgi:amidohydrolase